MIDTDEFKRVQAAYALLEVYISRLTCDIPEPALDEPASEQRIAAWSVNEQAGELGNAIIALGVMALKQREAARQTAREVEAELAAIEAGTK